MENAVGSTQPEHFVVQRRRSILLDYLIATSTHGLRSVGRAYSTCNRLVWIITFTIACALMLFFIVSSILQYLSYPTQTNVEIVFSPTMPFPAVTICSGTPYRYDKINESLVDFFYRLYPSNATFDQNSLNLLSLPLLVDLFNRNKIDQVLSMGYQLSDMLLQCTYNGINCSNAFTLSMSSIFGNCFTFNWKTSTQFFTISDFGDTMVMREGLQMTFYIPRESYFSSALYDIGLTVLLHSNDELPVPNENGLSLQPGLAHLITYQKSTTTFLPSPYTPCKSTVSDDLRALYQTTFMDQTASTVAAYSESVCQELCEQSYIFSKCSCIFPLPFLTRYVFTLDGNLVLSNCCNPLTEQLNCTYSAKQQFSAQLGPSDGEKELWASTLLNGNNTNAILVPSDFVQRFDYYFDRNYLSLLVAYGSKYVTQYNQEARLTVGDMFSAIGGQTGLSVNTSLYFIEIIVCCVYTSRWIGLSVLSIIELSEFVYRLLYKSITRWKSRRNGQVATGTIIIDSRY